MHRESTAAKIINDFVSRPDGGEEIFLVERANERFDFLPCGGLPLLKGISKEKKEIPNELYRLIVYSLL